jgi:hypothetical protein
MHMAVDERVGHLWILTLTLLPPLVRHRTGGSDAQGR